MPDYLAFGGYREWCRGELAPLSVRHWAAFAASCAERQFGTYQHVGREDRRLKPIVVRHAIDVGWAFASGDAASRSDLESLRRELEPLIPNLDEDLSSYASLILDATGATSYLLRVCAGGRIEDAVAAGECARNAVDECVRDSIFASPDGQPTPVTIRPSEYEAVHAKISSHSMMIREMRQQQADIAYLHAHPIIGPQDCLRIRQSWLNGAKSNIDLE